MKVFLTVDTEVWPDSPGWPHTPLSPTNDCAREFDSYFYGGTGAHKTGLQYQLEVLKRHNLKATYFVDPLFSYALGTVHLRRVLELINEHGQELGLHLHPEWLTDPRCAGLPKFNGPLLRQYSADEQAMLVRAGLARFMELGMPLPTAFRAGSWGADSVTLEVLRECGFIFDTSLDTCMSESFPTLPDRSRIRQPRKLSGVWEFPVTHFLDHSAFGMRPLQVCACSFTELRQVLDSAFDAGWFAAVIVLHSFEFVRVQRLRTGKPVTPQRLLARRFEALCAHLEANADRFETSKFADIDPAHIPVVDCESPLRSTRTRTALRYAEQLASRFY
jgi:hypothetical protein